MARENAQHVIVRTSWIYAPFGKNFVRTMVQLAATKPEVRVVADQHGCPTAALDVAAAILEMAERLLGEPVPLANSPAGSIWPPRAKPRGPTSPKPCSRGRQRWVALPPRSSASARPITRRRPAAPPIPGWTAPSSRRPMASFCRPGASRSTAAWRGSWRRRKCRLERRERGQNDPHTGPAMTLGNMRQNGTLPGPISRFIYGAGVGIGRP